MLKKFILKTLLCLLPTLSVYAALPYKVVVAEGFGETIALATKNARENAVRRAFGEVVDSVTETKNEELVESTISASNGFILNAKLLNAPKYDAKNKYYIVKIKVTVATEKLKDQINRFKKSSNAVDIEAQLKASDDAEIQEKNAFKLVNWFIGELPKTIKIDDIKLSILENNQVKISFSPQNDLSKIAELQDKVKKILLTNGYKRISLEHTWSSFLEFPSNGNPGSHFMIVNTPNIIKGMGWRNRLQYKDVEIYNNPEALLFYGPYNDTSHPQNYYTAPRTKAEVEIKVIKSNGQSKTIVKKEQRLLNYLSKSGSANQYCSFVPIIAGAYNYPDDTELTTGYRSNYELPLEDFDAKTTIEIAINITYPDQSTARHVLIKKSFDCTPFIAQKEGRETKSKALSKLLAKNYSEVFKMLKVQAEYKYDRFNKSGKATIEIETDKRAFFRAMRKLESQLSQLNCEQVSNVEDYYGTYVAAYTKVGNIGNNRDWKEVFQFKLPSVPKELLREELKKHKYFLVITFKDKAGEILQKKEFQLGRRDFMSFDCISFPAEYRNNMRGGFLLKFVDFNVGAIMGVNFDIPEDAKLVKVVECNVEERIAQ